MCSSSKLPPLNERVVKISEIRGAFKFDEEALLTGRDC